MKEEETNYDDEEAFMSGIQTSVEIRAPPGESVLVQAQRSPLGGAVKQEGVEDNQGPDSGDVTTRDEQTPIQSSPNRHFFSYQDSSKTNMEERSQSQDEETFSSNRDFYITVNKDSETEASQALPEPISS